MAAQVLSGLECAMWDLCGKALGVPAYRLLGGLAHDRLPRYASGGMDVGGVDSLLGEQRRLVDDGFLATKIRIGRDAESDFEKAASVRAVIGDKVGMAVDAVQGSNTEPWSAAQAIEVGRRLEPLGILWFEEPCTHGDVAGYAACRRALNIPIAGGETCATLEEFMPLFEAGALDIAQPDAAQTGGMLEVRKVGAAAARHGVNLAVHAWGSAPSVMANYHAGFATPNCAWLEYPLHGSPLVTELMVEPLRVIDGHVLPPTAPGLGVVLTPELEARYPYRPGHHYHMIAEDDVVPATA